MNRSPIGVHWMTITVNDDDDDDDDSDNDNDNEGSYGDRQYMV